PATPFDGLRILPRREERDDAGTLLLHPAAENFESCLGRSFTQMVGQRHDSLLDSPPANATECALAGAQGQYASHVQTPPFPASGVRLNLKVNLRKTRRPKHAVPADPDRMQPIDELAAHVEEPCTLRTQEPLVAIRRQRVHRKPAHIQGQNSQSLNCI